MDVRYFHRSRSGKLTLSSPGCTLVNNFENSYAPGCFNLTESGLEAGEERDR